MITLSQYDLIKNVFEHADKSLILESGHQAVAVEVTVSKDLDIDETFDGTLLYVPGVHFHELRVK